MAAYVKQGDQICLALSKAEAEALCAAVHAHLDYRKAGPKNPSVASAEERAFRALETAVQPGSRMGAAFQ